VFRGRFGYCRAGGGRETSALDLLKQLGLFLGWLSGVVAGITAFLYGLGFVATNAHQRVLGLDLAMVMREPSWFIGVGGQVAARWLLLAMVALLPMMLVGEALLWLARSLRARGRAVGLIGWIDRRIVWIIAVLSLVLAAVLMGTLRDPLGISGLLFLDRAGICRADGFAASLGANDGRTLSETADRVALLTAIAFGIGWYAAPRLIAQRGPAVPMFICAAVALQALGTIPVAHGILVMRKEVREMRVAGTSDREGFLITVARDGLWVWQPDAQRVQWLEQGSYQLLDIGKPIALRAAACG
jgi:hypothetical protein